MYFNNERLNKVWNRRRTRYFAQEEDDDGDYNDGSLRRLVRNRVA